MSLSIVTRTGVYRHAKGCDNYKVSIICLSEQFVHLMIYQTLSLLLYNINNKSALFTIEKTMSFGIMY